MKDLNEIITKLQSLIKQYREVRDSQNISLFLEIKDSMCAWSFRFAELTADLKISYNEFYFIRRINIAKTRQALIKNGSTIGSANTDALIKHEESYKKEQEYESLSYKADIMLRQTNVIIQAIQQRVSWLKVESKEYNN